MSPTTSSRKNYNRLALQGNPVDDMEFVDLYSLDPSLAYTPKINDAILDKVEQENYEFYTTQKGMTVDEARSEAMKNKNIAKTQIKELLAKNGMLK